MSPGDRAPIRVSQVTMEIRPYRRGFLDRMAQRDDVELVMYAGKTAPGLGSVTEMPAVAVEVRPIRNRFWPRHPLKVSWQHGAMAVLTDESDVVVLQEVVSNMTVWLIRLLHRRFGKRLILIGFFYRPDGKGRLEPVRLLMRRWLRSSAGALVCYTERGRRELMEQGADPRSVFVNSNTLDTSHLLALAETVTASDSAKVRERLGIPHGTHVLAFLGRLRPIKRVDVAMEAVRLLQAQTGGDYVLLVIGDGEERERLKSRAAGAPVRMVGQTYDEEELARLLSIAEMLVMPGSVGLACVHGFANGLPCLTTTESATTQTPEFDYIDDGRNGLVLEQPDPRLYAEAIKTLIQDPARLGDLRSGALATARSLEMDRMVDAFVAAVRHAAGGLQAPRA